MAQFEVYPNPNQSARATQPFVVVLQSDVTATRTTLIVAPLARKADPATTSGLQVPVLFAGEPFLVLFQSMAAVRSNTLDRPVGHLPQLRDTMMKAVDLLFLGF